MFYYCKSSNKSPAIHIFFSSETISFEFVNGDKIRVIHTCTLTIVNVKNNPFFFFYKNNSFYEKIIEFYKIFR